MRGWSFPIGRVMGVEIRLHMFFALLLALCFAYTNMVDMPAARGLALWLLLLAAVGVREIARSIAAAYYGLELRNILLLPIGGLFGMATPESTERASESHIQKVMAAVGPIASLGTGLVLAALFEGSASGVDLLAKPWITPAYLLRSMVWLNIFLGLINLLPAYPLDGGRVLRGEFSRTRGALVASRTAGGVGQAISLILFAAGILLPSPWLLMAGFFVFIGAQMEDQGTLFQSVVDTVRMRDIMLTEFSMLSASDTLEDAMHKSVHSLQDDFPVVRGQNLVGVISRRNILEALQSEGNGYVQGVMTRAFQVAQPEDSLGKTFRRITQGSGLQLVPVLEGERIIGIVTLQNLMHSMGLLAESRKLRQQA